jgi:pyrroloquinoline quinone biosynthesis protein D
MSESNITLESIVDLQRQYRFQFEPAQNSYVLLYPEGLVKLEGGAGEIMKRVDGKLSVEGIVQDLQESFPGVELRQDVIEFLEVAYGKGWIRIK